MGGATNIYAFVNAGCTNALISGWKKNQPKDTSSVQVQEFQEKFNVVFCIITE